MQLSKAGTHAGGLPFALQASSSSSSTRAARGESKHASAWDFMSDLGDLPGSGPQGEASHDLSALPHVVRADSPFPHEVVFAWDTWMQEGQALKPLPVRPASVSSGDDAVARSLTERQARVGQVKRKREDDAQDGTPVSCGTTASAYSSLEQVKPGSPSLGDAVTVLASEILQVNDAGDALAIGHELCRRLGNDKLQDADRDTVIAAVLRVAMERPHAAGLLGPLLAGLGTAQSRVNPTAGGQFAHALFKEAVRLSVDPLLAPGMPTPTVQAFEARNAAFKLAVDVLDRRALCPANVAWVVERLVQRILDTGSPQRSPQPARIAHAAAALASLGWLFDGERLSGELASVVRNVALHACATGGDPLPLGAALARAFGAPTRRDSTVDAGFVNALARTERLTDLPLNQFLHGYLLPDTGHAQACDTVLGKLTALAPGLSVLALGRVVHALSLCAAADRRWSPAPANDADHEGGAPDFAAQVLQALPRLKPAGKVALVCGLRAALNRIATHDAGFAALNTRLSAQLATRYPKGSPDCQAMLGALTLAGSPKFGLDMLPAAVTSGQRLELVRLLEVTSGPLSASARETLRQLAAGLQAEPKGKEGKGS